VQFPLSALLPLRSSFPFFPAAVCFSLRNRTTGDLFPQISETESIPLFSSLSYLSLRISIFPFLPPRRSSDKADVRAFDECPLAPYRQISLPSRYASPFLFFFSLRCGAEWRRLPFLIPGPHFVASLQAPPFPFHLFPASHVGRLIFPETSTSRSALLFLRADAVPGQMSRGPFLFFSWAPRLSFFFQTH